MRQPLTPAQCGQMGGLTTSLRHDTRAINEKARQVFKDSFAQTIREQNPDLPDEEVLRRAEVARKLHYTRLAHKSAEVRRAKASARRAGRSGGSNE